jgi:hypothetical protein
MSEAVTIDGVALLPIKDAAARASYTRDYVARLAREGKVTASRIGRQWFIDPASLDQFVAHAEQEKSIRQRELQLQRQREREVTQQLAAKHTVRKIELQRAPQRALAFSLTMLMVALMGGVGVSQWGGWMYLDPAHHIADVRLYPSWIAEPSSMMSAPTEMAELLPAPTHEVLPLPEVLPGGDEVVVEPLLSENALGILLVSEAGPVRTQADIEALFSDPVTLVQRADGQTEIQLADGSSTTTAPIIMIPLAATAASE